MFNWIKALLLWLSLKRNWADAEREERGVRALNRADAHTERERCARAEQSRCTHREREVCARWTEQTHRERERERGVRALNRADREREREVCARGSTGDSQKLGLGAFLKGKKSLKGSAMLLSWQHCASPFLQLRVGPRVKQKIRAALIAR